jgi:hypothetical protein
MKPRIVLPVLIALGLLALASVWYQSSSRVAGHFASEGAARLRERATPPIRPLPVIHRPPITKNQRGIEPKQSPRMSSEQEPAEKAIDAQTREVIDSFQTKAELLTARWDIELADQLDRDAADSSNDP